MRPVGGTSADGRTTSTCTPSARVYACREGRGCSPRSRISPRHAGRGRSPRRRLSACIANAVHLTPSRIKDFPSPRPRHGPLTPCQPAPRVVTETRRLTHTLTSRFRETSLELKNLVHGLTGVMPHAVGGGKHRRRHERHEPESPAQRGAHARSLSKPRRERFHASRARGGQTASSARSRRRSARRARPPASTGEPRKRRRFSSRFPSDSVRARDAARSFRGYGTRVQCPVTTS